MKKLLLVSALLAAGFSTASAQFVNGSLNASQGGKTLEKEIVFSKAPLKMTANKCSLDSKRANLPSTRADITAYYARPLGTYLPGVLITDEGIGQLPPCFIGSAFKNWTFRNYSTEGMSYSWMIGDTNMDENMDEAGNMTTMYGLGYYDAMPVLTVSDGSQQVTYQYGATRDQSGSIPEQRLIATGVEILPMTYIDLNYSMYTGFEGGSNAFGTGHVNGDEESPVMVAFAAVFEKPMSPLYMSGVTAFLLSEDGEASSLMPADGTLDLELRGVDEEGSITDEVIATAQMNAADLRLAMTFGNAKAAVYGAPFHFMEIDPATGLESQYNLIIDRSFAAVISGYNKPGYNFGIIFGEELNPYGSGNGRFQVEGDESFYGYPKSEEDRTNRFNIGVQVEAVNTTLYVSDPCQTVYVPDEGGLAYFDFNDTRYEFIQVSSTYPLEQDGETCVWMDEVPSWLSVEPNEDEFETSRIINFIVTGEPLPEGVGGRRETLVFRSFGVEAWANVLQGADAINATSAVSIVKAIKNGDNFDLTYPEEVNAVTVLNAAGQTIATYELPANGQFTMPAANLTKGLYILKFNGEKTAGVKIVK